MSSFESSGLNEAYTRVQKVGDKLADFETLIEWEIFRPIFEGMYHNTTEKGGLHNIDVIVMIKILVSTASVGLIIEAISYLENSCCARRVDTLARTCSNRNHFGSFRPRVHFSLKYVFPFWVTINFTVYSWSFLKKLGLFKLYFNSMSVDFIQIVIWKMHFVIFKCA